METLKQQGNQAYQKGDYQLAVTIYTQAIEQFPEESALLGNRSAALFMLKMYNEAEKDCQNVLQKDEQNEKVKLRLGKIYLAKGELQQAKELFQQIQNTQQIQIVDELKKYAGYHEKAVSEKNYQETLFYINKLVEQCPAHKPFLFKKLQTLISYGQLENALAFFQSSQREVNNTVELLYWKGAIFYYMNNHQKATSCFRELLMQEPNYTQAMAIVKKIRQLENLKEQGNNLFKDKSFHEAIASYTQALDVDSEHNQYNSLILNNRSACHIGLEQYDLALKDCNKAIEIHPFNAKAYLRRGNIKLKIEDCDPNEAIQDYEKARELDSSIDIRSNVQEAKLIMKKRARKDYYKILGIKEKATEDEIRKAYKKKAIEWHPDKHSNGMKKIKKEQKKCLKMQERHIQFYQILKKDRDMIWELIQKKQIKDFLEVWELIQTKYFHNSLQVETLLEEVEVDLVRVDQEFSLVREDLLKILVANLYLILDQVDKEESKTESIKTYKHLNLLKTISLLRFLIFTILIQYQERVTKRNKKYLFILYNKVEVIKSFSKLVSNNFIELNI